MASLILKATIFYFSSTTPFLLLASSPVVMDFPPPYICKMKMTDSKIQISEIKEKREGRKF